jgi:anti-sigma-K factor RskA
VSSPHDELTLLAPAYALGALDADERRAFEAHLSTCQVCAAEVRSLARIAAGLAQTPTQVSPRPELRDRVLTAVGASAASHRVRTAAPAVRSSGVAVWLPLAATLVLAAGFAMYAWDQRNQIRDLAGRLEQSSAGIRESEKALIEARRAADEAQAAVGVLTAPDLVRIDLKGQAGAPLSSARAMWSRQRGMVFSGTNLPPLPAGRVYQVWVITDQGPLSAGLLTADGSGVFMTPVDIPPPRQVAVTIEAAGGVAAPTMDPFLSGFPVAG